MMIYIHSYWAFLVLFLLLLACINALTKRFTIKPYTSKDFRLNLFTLIVTHIQFILGLITYFTVWHQSIAMGSSLMKTLEHPLTNLIAIILITIGWSKHKKVVAAKSKFTKIGVFYSLGFILILSRIPWQSWLS